MKKVFIDAGGYTGDTVQLFIEKYPDGADFDAIYCFEPNPAFKQQLQAPILAPFAGSKYIFSPKAVWIEDCTLNFYLAQNPLGSSVMKEKGGRSKLDKSHPIKVEAFDFSKWIKENFSKEDFLVVKFDIEGAEYKVIQKMIDEGTIHYIKDLYVDWHARKLEGFDHTIHANMVEHLNSIGLSPREMCGETWKIQL